MLHREFIFTTGRSSVLWKLILLHKHLYYLHNSHLSSKIFQPLAVKKDIQQKDGLDQSNTYSIQRLVV